MKLTQTTKINAIIIIDKKRLSGVISKDMNMTLLEWTIKYSFSDKSLSFGRLPNLLDMNFQYKQDGSNGNHKMSSYLFEDENYQVYINIFDKSLAEQN